jgi:hypothetical protein
MNYVQAIFNRFLGIFLIAAILIGCGAKPGEFRQTAGEMKEGPGVLSGEEGEFAVYDSKRGGPFWKHSKENAEEAAKEESEAAGRETPATSDKPSETTQVAAGQTSKESDVSPEAAREFQQFQEWKKEQKEFQQFQEWKKTSKGAAEYREFLEWKEWKSYQEWKKRQEQ